MILICKTSQIDLLEWFSVDVIGYSVIVNISFQSYLSSVINSFVQSNLLPPRFFASRNDFFIKPDRRCHCGRFSCLAVVSDRESGVTLEGPEDGLSLPQLTENSNHCQGDLVLSPWSKSRSGKQIASSAVFCIFLVDKQCPFNCVLVIEFKELWLPHKNVQ